MSRPKKGQEHPREELRNQIKLMAAIGIPHAQMAGVLKIGLDTLHNHYKDDLEYGASSANTVVGGKIFEAAKRGESWACTLWAARRMGWKETSTTVHEAGDTLGQLLNAISETPRLSR
ncbi:MAG: hypothetical protein RIR33_3871 [Pseudomonadota bacterium]|jgi:hypothetical protein